MDEAQRLIAKAERLAATGERLGAAFARELARVFRDVDREVRQLLLAAEAGGRGAAISAVRAIALKEQIRDVLRGAGYDRTVAAATATGADAVLSATLGAAVADEVAGLVASISPQIEALRRLATADLFGKGDEIAVALWRSIVQQLYSGRAAREIVADLAEAIDQSLAEAQALFDTAVSIFGRQVEAVQTEALGDQQPYLFAGPIDDRTRPFCLDRVGRVYTRAEIDQMDNGQMPGVLLTGGGYNCRHSWLAVESQELKAMVGTTERIPEVAADVARAKARRAARRKGAA